MGVISIFEAHACAKRTDVPQGLGSTICPSHLLACTCCRFASGQWSGYGVLLVIVTRVLFVEHAYHDSLFRDVEAPSDVFERWNTNKKDTMTVAAIHLDQW